MTTREQLVLTALLSTRYHISSDAGALAILGYQHNNLEEPSLIALNWFSQDRS
jgi:hypothetical protein